MRRRKAPTAGLSEAGFSMVELMIAVTVLAVTIAGAASAWTTSVRLNQLVREEANALRWAERKIAEIRATPFDDIVDEFDGQDFNYRADMPLASGHEASMGRVLGGVPRENEGEVIIIKDEDTSAASDFDHDGDGSPVDQVELGGAGASSLFPLDLDGDGTGSGGFGTEDHWASPEDLELIPVVVVVEWRSLAGPTVRGRVQLMTVIGR